MVLEKEIKIEPDLFISFEFRTQNFIGIGFSIESFKFKENSIHLILPFISLSVCWYKWLE